MGRNDVHLNIPVWGAAFFSHQDNVGQAGSHVSGLTRHRRLSTASFVESAVPLRQITAGSKGCLMPGNFLLRHRHRVPQISAAGNITLLDFAGVEFEISGCAFKWRFGFSHRPGHRQG